MKNGTYFAWIPARSSILFVQVALRQNYNKHAVCRRALEPLILHASRLHDRVLGSEATAAPRGMLSVHIQRV